MRAAGLLARQGNRMEALREARAILAEDQDDPAVHELVAALSCCDEDVTESFLHYKMALDLGGLARPVSRLAALVQARRLGEPVSTSAAILAGAPRLERLALRTASSWRVVGYPVVALIALGWFWVGQSVWLGAGALTVASALAGWWTFCRLYLCWNRQELSRFAVLIASAWITFAILLWTSPQIPWVVLVGSLGAVVVITELQQARKRGGPAIQPSHPGSMS